MSSLFLLFLLFYCRKFSSSRWADLISLWRSFTRCRAAFSLLSRRLRDGFLKYLLSLRVLSTPSFIMRFLRRETARSGFSLRLIFTVNIFYSWLGCAAALQQLVSVYPLHEYCIIHYCVCQVAWRCHQGSPRFTPEYRAAAVLLSLVDTDWLTDLCLCCAAPCCGVPLRWRFGLCGVGCGWCPVERRWIKMTCITQQNAPISPIHRHNVI